MSSLFLQHQSKHEEQKERNRREQTTLGKTFCNVSAQKFDLRLHQNGEEREER